MDILCGPCPSSVPGPEKIYVLCGLCPHLRGYGRHVWPVPEWIRGIAWSECSQRYMDLQPRYHLLHRPPAPGWRPPRAHPRPTHSQYLMTAMLTGAVQVTARYGFSEAMAEEH